MNEPHVLDFCQEVAPNSPPAVVSCMSLTGEAIHDCFATVDGQVQMHGGQRVLGWAIWELPGVFIEAEFHAVWARPSDGGWVDIAARPLPFESITFVADPARQYIGRQVDNIRKPLSRDPRVRQFIYLSTLRFQILNAGPLVDQHGAIELSRGARKEYDAVMRDLARLAKILFRQ